KIAQKYIDKIFDKAPERSAQRNYGMIKLSKGDYVMFVDADMILGPKVIEGCVELIESRNYLALHITEIVLGKTYWSCVRRFERSFYEGTVIDGARFFKKTAFIDVGGFDEDLSGPEDWDIDKKIKKNGKIGLLKKTFRNEEFGEWKLKDYIAERGVDFNENFHVIFHNEAEINLKKYLLKKWYYSGSFDKYIAKWGSRDEDVRSQIGFWYRFLGVFIEKGKWKQLIKSAHLAIGMYLLRVMVGMAFLFRKPR
ncbi:MAG: glycosyltransferase, partial [Nitrospinales bacterium]